MLVRNHQTTLTKFLASGAYGVYLFHELFIIFWVHITNYLLRDAFGVRDYWNGFTVR